MDMSKFYSVCKRQLAMMNMSGIKQSLLIQRSVELELYMKHSETEEGREMLKTTAFPILMGRFLFDQAKGSKLRTLRDPKPLSKKLQIIEPQPQPSAYRLNNQYGFVSNGNLYSSVTSDEAREIYERCMLEC